MYGPPVWGSNLEAIVRLLVIAFLALWRVVRALEVITESAPMAYDEPLPIP